jgi:hypothetical protein
MSTSASLVANTDVTATSAPWLRSAQSTAQVRDFVLPNTPKTGSPSVEREAYERGFADGHRTGTETSAAAVAARVARLSAGIAEISSLRTGLLKSSEQDIVRLSLAIARRILGREAAADPSLLLNLARAASAKLAGTGVISIEMHPTEFACRFSRSGSERTNPRGRESGPAGRRLHGVLRVRFHRRVDRGAGPGNCGRASDRRTFALTLCFPPPPTSSDCRAAIRRRCSVM